MRALDTNVVLRLLIVDDPLQLAVAERLIEEPAYLPLTVLMETVWVLRSRYGMGRDALARALNSLLDAQELSIEGADLLPWIIDRIDDGADAADMIHLAASRHATSFATFDRDLARRADGSPVPVELVE